MAQVEVHGLAGHAGLPYLSRSRWLTGLSEGSVTSLFLEALVDVTRYGTSPPPVSRVSRGLSPMGQRPKITSSTKTDCRSPGRFPKHQRCHQISAP